MQSCPFDDGSYSGNCEFCNQNTDCVLLAILQKVKTLELLVEKMASQTA